jgi:hypothetical protein
MKVRTSDSPEDKDKQRYIRARANFSMSVLGAAFARNGSGAFLNIRKSSQAIASKKQKVSV